MNARLAEDVFLESEFFDRADAMREQFAAALESPENGILKHVSSPGAYSFFLAPAAQVFTQDLVFAFLNRLPAAGQQKSSAHITFRHRRFTSVAQHITGDWRRTRLRLAGIIYFR